MKSSTLFSLHVKFKFQNQIDSKKIHKRFGICFALKSISIAKNECCGMPFFPEDFRFATRAPKYRVDLYFLPTKNVSTSRELRIVTWFFFYVVCFEGHLNRSATAGRFPFCFANDRKLGPPPSFFKV